MCVCGVGVGVGGYLEREGETLKACLHYRKKMAWLRLKNGMALVISFM